MAEKIDKVLHKRSNQLVEDAPKLPTPEQLEYGEIAINYASEKETISIKNANNEIATFSSDKIIDKKLEAKADKTAISDMLTKTEASSTYAKASHTHTASQVTDLQGKLDAKADKTAISDMLTKTEASSTYATKEELPDEYVLPIASSDLLGGIKIGAGLSINPETGVVNTTGGGVADSVDWNNITSKPETFKPEAHQHVSADITDLQGKLDVKADKTAISDMLTKTEASSAYAKVSHTHTASQVTDLQGKLDVKADKTAISDMLTKTEASSAYQPKGSYLTSVPVATTESTGGIKIGYSTNGKNYKVQIDGKSNGFVNVPWTDNNSVTHIYAGSGAAANAATINGNTKLTIADDSTVRGSITIKGSGATTVTSDANGVISINSTNTTYSLVGASGTTGLIKNGSNVISNSGYTACPIISGVPYYKDTNTTYTLSSFGVTATSAELNYCDGVTSNIQTQLNGKAASGQTMYLGTTAVKINRASASGLTLNGVNISGTAGSVSWNNVSGKPSSYNPSTHTHSSEQITDIENLFKSEKGTYNENTLPPSFNGSVVFYNTDDHETSVWPGSVFSFRCSASSWSCLQFRFPGGGHDGILKYRAVLDNAKPKPWRTIASTDYTQTWSAYQDFKAGAGNSGSDIRFKEIYKESIGNVLDNIQDIKIFPYKWIKEGETNWDTFGVDANQLLEKGDIYAKMVHERDDVDKTKFVDYERFGLIAIKAIQELTHKVQELESIIQKIKNDK